MFNNNHRKNKMMKNKILAVFAVATLFFTGCRDEFAEINTNPNDIDKANIPYLFSQGLWEFNPNDYDLWFYNARYMSHLAQAYIPTAGYYPDYVHIIAEMGGQGSKAINVLKYAREIDYLTSLMGEEGEQYAQLRAILTPLIVYLGILDSDMYGSRPFSEAATARYGGTLTPKYDTVEEQYNLFLTMLDETLNVFANPPGAQTLPSNQDFIYKCDISKWAKLTNSLKLKIAVRLLHQDKARALQIAKDVAANPVGVISPSEDLLYNKGTQEFGTGAALDRVTAITQPLTEFLVSHLDPRIRFVATKNGYNSKIVQGLFNQEVTGKFEECHLPGFILSKVDYTVDDTGKKIFQKWKAPGEPWVRYYGIPTDLDANTNTAVYGDYFQSTRWRIYDDSGSNYKAYAPYSRWPEEMVRGLVDYSIPTLPGDADVSDTEDCLWYFFHFTSAEVNLYFAELKLLGADLPATAQQYYNDGVKQSVEVYDRLANLNHIPYYHTTYGYDPNEATIDLKAGEIDAMMLNPDYQLTGSVADQLEKVYIQQYIHFLLSADDQYVSIRRSGVPKVNSKLLPWNPIELNTMIPRRMEIPPLNISSLMYEIEKQAYEDQGFTPGAGISEPSFLNRERVWQDKGAPNFGEGPNF